MKKKHVLAMVVIILITILALIGILIFSNQQNDGLKFKKEYENLNGEKSASGKEYLELNIPKDNKIYYASYEEVMDVLDHGTGIIYFGFPECPWCRNAVPALLEATEETSIDKIYYFNALSIRDKKSLDENGNIVTEQKGTKEYYQLVEALSSVLGPYQGLNDETILRLYFPTVVFVKDGKIIGSHEGTITSQENPYVGLTETQKEELKKIYTDYIHEMLGDLCIDKC